jgi:hypothetical protein
MRLKDLVLAQGTSSTEPAHRGMFSRQAYSPLKPKDFKRMSSKYHFPSCRASKKALRPLTFWRVARVCRLQQ